MMPSIVGSACFSSSGATEGDDFKDGAGGFVSGANATFLPEFCDVVAVGSGVFVVDGTSPPCEDVKVGNGLGN